MIVELLQQLGLNKYEAEAYATLLASGPLTGYELGKRSQVPLSRSYEVLERLTQKGLALVQPADPPRYAAEDPVAFLARTRARQAATLDALDAAFAALPRARSADDFWVVRGRGPILARARALIGAAQHTIAIATPDETELESTLDSARARGCQVAHYPSREPHLLLLIDGQQTLVGTLTPAETCQAVTGTNPALIAAVHARFHAPALALASLPAPSLLDTDPATCLDWLAWETDKQRRLLGLPDNAAA